jgi:hypothetical protein
VLITPCGGHADARLFAFFRNFSFIFILASGEKSDKLLQWVFVLAQYCGWSEQK